MLSDCVWLCRPNKTIYFAYFSSLRLKWFPREYWGFPELQESYSGGEPQQNRVNLPMMFIETFSISRTLFYRTRQILKKGIVAQSFSDLNPWGRTPKHPTPTFNSSARPMWSTKYCVQETIRKLFVAVCNTSRSVFRQQSSSLTGLLLKKSCGKGLK